MNSNGKKCKNEVSFRLFLRSEQLQENKIFNQVQQQVKRNSWMQKIQYALYTNYKVPYRRCKLLVVGNGGVRKTSTIRSLLNQDFNSEYNSTEVADANVQVSLLSAANWRQQINHTDIHLMDNDFKQVVAQIEEDKALETYAPEYDTYAPALVPKVVEAVATSSALKKIQVKKAILSSSLQE